MYNKTIIEFGFRMISWVIIQQIVTLSKYGRDMLSISVIRR